MGHIKGLFTIEGLVGNLIFYKTKDGRLVRSKGTLDRNRIKNDPAFLRTRENNMEFGNAREIAACDGSQDGKRCF